MIRRECIKGHEIMANDYNMDEDNYKRGYEWANEGWRMRQDMRYMKSQYLPMSIEILGYVEDECDMMEYAGSLMFDEYPDKSEVERVAKRIYEKAKYLENFYKPVQEEDEMINAGNHCTSCRGQENWLENLIRVILLNEMNYRRQRYHQYHMKCYKKRF